ncbi:hypothetical protein NW762_003091 [Fusarium torreyae]|uniref:Ankyrin repeat protein n=1 Tax=Fusarium torreyae TaxID=1237075 RepID=A0A9W8S9S1_9HYPO|nr:hypothetical protein NW762_003091 [Fusarium torreyae]
MASDNGHADVVKTLLDQGADFTITNSSESMFLIHAAVEAYANVAKPLVWPEAENYYGSTASLSALANSHCGVVELLTTAGTGSFSADPINLAKLVLGLHMTLETTAGRDISLADLAVVVRFGIVLSVHYRFDNVRV